MSELRGGEQVVTVATRAAANGSGPSIQVVIPSHNGGELTLACLERVLPQLRGRDRLVVVDNGSWDGTAKLIAHRFGASVKVEYRRRPLGFAGACNLGASQASADLLLFLNQDLMLDPESLEGLRESARSRPRAIIGATLLGPEGTRVQHVGGTILPNGLTEHPLRGTPLDRLPRQGFLQCDYATGAVFLVPQGAFEALRGFDVRFSPSYFEETDFCVRARSSGIHTVVALAVTARHFEAVVTGKDTFRYHYAYHRNRLRFVMKHYTRHALQTVFLPAERAWLSSALSSAARRGVHRAYAALAPEVPRWLIERRRRPPSFVPQEVAP